MPEAMLVEMGYLERVGCRWPHRSLLFDGLMNIRTESGTTYDVHPKGNRFLVIRLEGENVSATTIRVVTNWFEELKRTVK